MPTSFFFPLLTINILSQNSQLTLFLIISKIDWAFQVFQCTAMWLFPILWSFLWLSLVPFWVFLIPFLKFMCRSVYHLIFFIWSRPRAKVAMLPTPSLLVIYPNSCSHPLYQAAALVSSFSVAIPLKNLWFPRHIVEVSLKMENSSWNKWVAGDKRMHCWNGK